MHEKIKTLIKEIRDYKGKAKQLHKGALDLCRWIEALSSKLNKADDENEELITILYNLKKNFYGINDSWKNVKRKANLLGEELADITTEWDTHRTALSSFGKLVKNWPIKAPDTQMVAVPLGWCRTAQGVLNLSKLSNVLTAEEVVLSIDDCSRNIKNISKQVEKDIKDISSIEKEKENKCPICKGSGKDPILLDAHTNELLPCSSCSGLGVQ